MDIDDIFWGIHSVQAAQGAATVQVELWVARAPSKSELLTLSTTKGLGMWPSQGRDTQRQQHNPFLNAQTAKT